VATKEGKAGVALYGRDDDGTLRDWCAWNLHNKRQVAATKPMPGDRIRITFIGRDPNVSNPALAAKWFTIEIIARAGETVLDADGFPKDF
jgi:hypothetical protein